MRERDIECERERDRVRERERERDIESERGVSSAQENVLNKSSIEEKH